MVDLSKFKDIFVSEVEDNLQKLNNGLLKLEKTTKEGGEAGKIYNELMQASHTIKGSSASMGYTKMAFLSHVIEDVFDGARNNKLAINEKIINEVFSAVDNLEKTLTSIKEKNIELDFDDCSARLKEITGVNTAGIGKSIRSNENNVVSNTPITAIKEEEKAEVKKGEEKKDKSDAETINQAIENAKVNYIKVPVARLDALLDLVEELLIDKMRLNELSVKSLDLKEIASHINLLVSGIQYEVMQARLVPVDQVFARFPRMVRDLAQKEKKEIEFNIRGGEIELDRTVVDKLGEPLIHLLRNAVDHGVKDKGKIKLEALRRNERVLFIVENIGQGMNYEKIREVAVKKGIVSARDIERYDENKLVNLLFTSSFSTSDKVTEISGRGVGLSVVKKFVESFGGRVMVENIPSGARFILELPLTLAIINSLLVEIDSYIFAIPFSSIERSVIVPVKDIKRMADYDTAVIDGMDVGLIKLKDIFDKKKNGEKILESLNVGRVDPASVPEKNEEPTSIIVVLVKKGKELAGIVVDKLLSEQEVIVKPFSPILQNIKDIKGFSGSTILGNGKVILILDVIGLLKYLIAKES